MRKLINLLKDNDLFISIYFFLKTYALNVFFYKKDIRIHYSSIIHKVYFAGHNRVHKRSEIYNSTIDSFTYVSYNTVIQNSQVGKFCSIGPDCKIGLGNHPSNSFVSTHPLFFSEKSQFRIQFCNKTMFKEFQEIIIGNDVWIGANVKILDGVRIGDGAIIGAGSVVTKDIQAYTINVGVPSRAIKKRFNDEEIAYLEECKWWNLDPGILKQQFKLFGNIDLFRMDIKNL